jgi:GT2 family glycosyltransferase
VDDAELVSSAPAPPVVTVMVVHEPGPWFGETLTALAAQDYPNLRHVVVLTETSAAVGERVLEALPEAHLRQLSTNPGFGAAANEILRLVEGDNGFFCFVHDDIAPAPDAISQMIDEVFRSNAAVLGPKVVDWDDPSRLQSVGVQADRFGATEGIAEPGESDQEQHDAVRDVFCLSTAMLCVRADLFRTLGGFEPSIEAHGDGLDLCWRAHLSGARVMVVPNAVVRHRGALVQRRPDLEADVLGLRQGLLSALSLSGRWRMLATLFVAPLVGVVAAMAGIVTGRVRHGVAVLRAALSAWARLGTITARRRRLRGLRTVPDSEVASLQRRGSISLAALFRRRHGTEIVRDRTRAARRSVRSAGRLAVTGWGLVLAVFLIGSRDIISRRMPEFGTFLPIPTSGSELFTVYTSGWWPSGLGRSEAAPTGVALLGIANMLSLGNSGLLRTVLVLGPILAGLIGAFHVSAVFRSMRARIAALVVYAANPLPWAAIAAGRWAPLAVYGAFPWAFELLRRASGLQAATAVFDPDGAEITDAVAVVGIARQIRLVASLALLEAVVAAFVPAFPLLVLVAAALFAASTLAVRGTAASLSALGTAAIAALVAFALHLPWSARFLEQGAWGDLMANNQRFGSLGFARLARFEIGHVPLAPIGLALFAPLVIGVLLARGWRLTWMARSAALVLVFGALAVASDAGTSLPEPGVLLVPVAFALALGAAGSVVALDDDVRGGRIGWRQPVGLGSLLAIAVATVPLVANMGNGRWQAPTPELAGVLGSLPTDPPSGDFRILYVGDARVLPLPGRPYRGGVSYAISDDGPLNVLDLWQPRASSGDLLVQQALDSVSSNNTLRAGHLLAPLGIRYIVVPLIDGLQSSRSQPLPAPLGIEDAFSDQIDLKRSSYVSDQAIVFENTEALPLRSVLSGATQVASQTAGAQALIQADYSDRTPVFVGKSAPDSARGPVPAGTFHDSVGNDERWRLRVNGRAVEERSAFGWSMAYEVPEGGTAQLSYRTDFAREVMLLLQVILWLMAVAFTARFSGWRRWLMRRRQSADAPQGPVIRLDDSGSGLA